MSTITSTVQSTINDSPQKTIVFLSESKAQQLFIESEKTNENVPIWYEHG